MDFLSVVVFPFINFFIFIGLLYWLAKKPAREHAQKKSEDFLLKRKASNEALMQAQKKLQDVEARVLDLNNEILWIKKEHQKILNLKSAEIEEKTARQIKQLEQELVWLLESQKKQAQHELSVEIMLEVKSQLLQKSDSLSANEHKAIITQAEDKLQNLVAG